MENKGKSKWWWLFSSIHFIAASRSPFIGICLICYVLTILCNKCHFDLNFELDGCRNPNPSAMGTFSRLIDYNKFIFIQVV